MQQFISGTIAWARNVLNRAHEVAVDVKLAVGAILRNDHVVVVKPPCLKYKVECFRPDGSLRWADEFTNIVFDGGINDLLDKYFAGSAYTASFFMGLVDNAAFSAFAAADTAASHAGWAESAAYSNATRPAVTWSAAASKSKAASAACVFNINATATINGAFLITNSTKSGTTGILYSAGSFAATRSVVSGDTLNVTPTVSGA